MNINKFVIPFPRVGVIASRCSAGLGALSEMYEDMVTGPAEGGNLHLAKETQSQRSLACILEGGLIADRLCQ